jgi:hypothetical protein
MSVLAPLRRLEAEEIADERGLRLERLDGCSYEEAEALGRFLGAIRDWTAFAIGDWLRFVEAAFPDRVSQMVEATGRAYRTLENYRWVAGRIPIERRRTPTLSFSHHREVAKLDPPEQERWLDRAAEQGLTSETLRAERMAEERGEILERVTLREAAQRVWSTAQRNGPGYTVPAEPMLVLASTLGVAS